MAKLTVDQWNTKEDIQLSNVRGFSMLEKLPRLLKEAYPDLVPFKFGFFIENDLPDRYSDGWKHLTYEDFPAEDVTALNVALSNKGAWTEETSQTKKIGDINEKVKLRFNVQVDAQGRVKYKKNFIMIQPTDYFLLRRKKFHEVSERQFSQTATREDGVAPAEGWAGASVTHEETQGPLGTVKRGRPKKGK